MIGDAVLYAASRATSSAVESVTRKITWTATAIVFMLSAFVVALILGYSLIEPYLGAANALGAIAGTCFVVGLACILMPTLIEHIEKLRRERQSPVEASVAVVEQEAREAVDHFGALQVVGSAFLFGLGAARRLKRS